ncbi:PEP-CTERM/exosortase system-associated acyltransferase [Arhodomonas sp. SL1]|uniref:PEP-CTERM/exosortase system-associated acyltransferase n=1 Tax=Arhodomonas sp. SL1 TaxID=3425691 RepID=UPI003F880474
MRLQAPVSQPGSTAAPLGDACALFERHFAIEIATTPGQLNEVHALRYQVYCVENPFEDASQHPDGREIDAFDANAVHALVRHRASGVCCGAVRLVLARPDASMPFEEHGHDHLYPDAQAVLRAGPRECFAEISRFAVSKAFRRRCGEIHQPHGVASGVTYTDSTDGRRLMPHVTLGLFAGVVRLSALHGITHWLAVMEPTLLRLLRRFGIGLAVAGSDVDYHGRRRPTLSDARSVITEVGAVRPDVWWLATGGGRVIPRGKGCQE